MSNLLTSSVLDQRSNFSVLGATTWTAFLKPKPKFAHFEYLIPMVVDMNDGPMRIFGAMTQLNGEAFLPYAILPPVIEWRLHPRVPPPFQFSTVDGSIQGAVDGVNAVFMTSVLLSRMQVYVNGVCQVLGKDCAAPWGQFIKFCPGSIPQKGDVVTCEGWTNL